MLRSLSLLLIALAWIWAPPAMGEDAGAGVPIVKAPYHLPVFRNQYVTLLNVYVPPGRNTGYHIHTGDSVSVNIEDADMTNQDLGSNNVSAPRHSQRGRASYADYRKQPHTHKATNVGQTPFHNISFIFNSPEPWHFTPGTREAGTGYTQIMDNERARGWRLILEPGQAAAAITQQAPGIRIVLSGGEIVESVPGQPERAMNPKMGEFFWQEPGVTRTIRNIGANRIELVEFELK